jgi:hypothetical protein
MKALLCIEAAREISLATWDEPAGDAVRVEFVDVYAAETYLRQMVDTPLAESSLRAVLAHEDPSSLPGDDRDALVRGVARHLVDRRLDVHERVLSRHHWQLPTGPEQPLPRVEPTDPTEPIVPQNAKPQAKHSPPVRWTLEATVEGEREDHCFDESILHLRATPHDGPVTQPTAVFAIFRNGVQVHREEVPTSAPRLDWPVAPVGDDETAWMLEFTFTYAQDVYTGNRVFTVWPRTLRLRARHFHGDTPVKGCPFVVTQEGTPQRVETPEVGEVLHPLALPAPFSVRVDPPFVVRAWTRDRGRLREAQVEEKYKAAFHAPRRPAPDGVIEQYVNLTSADHGRDGRGSRVLLRVGAEGDADRAVGERKGRQGDVLYVKVLFARTSQRNSPLPAVSGLQHTETLDALTMGRVALGPQGTAEFALELGLAGGDACIVSVGITPEADDQTITFVNWRKLFYQVTHPSTSTMPAMARITACLEEIFVRYERYKTLAFSESDGPPPAGAWFDGPMMGLPAGRKVCIGDHNKAHFHAKFDDQKTPLGVHVLVCHKQFDGGNPAHQSVLTETIAASTHTPTPFPPTTGTPAWCHTIDITTVTPGANVFPKAIQDGADAVRNATWTSLATAGPHAGAHGTVPADHVHVDWVNHRNVVTIKLPPQAAAVVDAGAPVRLRYTVLWALGEYLGESDGKRPNLQLLVDMANTSFNDVMAHELGHTMGAVLKSVPPGLSASDHGWKYTGRGHMGPHCAFGAPAHTFHDATQDLTGLGAHCKCIMYGENSSQGSLSSGHYCEKCVPFLCATALQDITK